MRTTDLSSLLHPKTYKLGLGSDGKFQALQELLDLLVRSHDLSLRQLAPAREAVFKVARNTTTGAPSGAAVAAATVDGLAAPVAALGTHEGGLDFGGDAPSRVVLLLLTPSGTSLESFPQLGALRSDSALVDELAKAGSAGDAEQVLRDMEVAA